jgi:hypothetical protein
MVSHINVRFLCINRFRTESTFEVFDTKSETIGDALLFLTNLRNQYIVLDTTIKNNRKEFKGTSYLLKLNDEYKTFKKIVKVIDKEIARLVNVKSQLF